MTRTRMVNPLAGDGEEAQRGRRVIAVSYLLYQHAKPVTSDTVVKPGSLFLDGGTKGQLLVDKDQIAGLLRGLHTEVGFTPEQIFDALWALDEQRVIAMADAAGLPQPIAGSKQGFESLI